MSRVKKPAVGANVLKYCRENERMASMENSQRQYVMVKAEAKWHEKQGQLLISGRMAKDSTVVSCNVARQQFLGIPSSFTERRAHKSKSFA
eukprot:1683879-Rhodomonas_salina.1